MKRSPMLLAALGVVLAITLLPLAAACGGAQSSAGSPSPTPSASAVDRQAVEAYFSALAPTVSLDYALQEKAKLAIATLAGGSDPSAREPWVQFAAALHALQPQMQEVLDGYRAVQPPPQLAAAHADLLQLNQMGIEMAAKVIADVDGNLPVSQCAQDFIAAADAQVPVASEMRAAWQTTLAEGGGLQAAAAKETYEQLQQIYAQQQQEPSQSPSGS